MGSPPRMRGKVMRKEILRIIHGITPAYAGKREGPKNAQSKVGDHPRVCGEKCIPLTRGHGRQGSPPRMRGKVQLGEIDLQDIWITPAYAGKSGPCPDRVPPAGDHPRVCGEKSQSTSASPRALGSPPRMRGKGVKQSNSRIRMGITPAYAGKRVRPCLTCFAHRDHPRVCGEKHSRAPAAHNDWGSPPRMRGKVDVFFTFVIPGRITPAYAGKRISLHTVCRCLWDHPRVCGEKVTDFHLFWHFGGSPPRMRGKETGKTRRVQWPGITPAYAGKRIPNSFPSCSVWDHPRVCGEKRGIKRKVVDEMGSPPRMRGKAEVNVIYTVLNGITPAYAGKSLLYARIETRPGDHPRVCGEKYSLACCPWPASGSPPRMRGKAARPRAAPERPGITPAYAGKRRRLSSRPRS